MSSRSLRRLRSSWNVMAHGDAREGKWRGNRRMECVTSTLHTTSEHGVSSIITTDVHTSAASSRLNWRPRRFKWTRTFRRKTKSGFCACAITFQTQSTVYLVSAHVQSHFERRLPYIWFLRMCHHISNAVYRISGFCACAITFQTQSNSFWFALSPLQIKHCARIVRPWFLFKKCILWAICNLSERTSRCYSTD
jgi:hypothetical protein